MEKDLYERRGEVVAERDALVAALGGLRNYFVATFAEELPTRWDWAERAWFRAHTDLTMTRDLAGLSNRLEGLDRRARETATVELAGSEVWGHEGSEDEIWRMRPYAEGPDSQWTHVSDAMARAEEVVFGILESHFGEEGGIVAEWESGVVSDALVSILEVYSQAFGRLQKVARAMTRLNSQISEAEAELARAERWS